MIKTVICGHCGNEFVTVFNAPFVNVETCEAKNISNSVVKVPLQCPQCKTFAGHFKR